MWVQGTTLQVQRKVDGLGFVCKQVVCESIGAANHALKEAKTLQRLDHVSICRYEDVFLHELLQGYQKKLVVCIVMEFCEKGDLAGAIGYHRDRRTPIPETLLAQWAKEMFEGLEYIHGAGVLHRDLKSPNIFITRSGSVKLGDFGLARQVTGEIRSRVGTPCYLAPEVLQSDSYAEPADVWGAGCCLFEAITLCFLWDRKGMLGVQVLSDAINASKLPPHYSSEMRSIVCQMLDKTPSRRPAVSTCLAAFARCMAGAGSPARQMPPEEQQPQMMPRTLAEDGRGEQQQQQGNQGQSAKPRKRDEAMNGVHAAVQAAKLAAKTAAEAAGKGLQAINGAQQGAERPVLGELRTQQPPQRPGNKIPADDRPQHPHRPPDQQQQIDPEIEQYERALFDHRRAQEGMRRTGFGGRDLSASGYPIVLKNGLEIFVRDEDLLAGMAPFREMGATSDEDIVNRALGNNGFQARYIKIHDNPRNVATIAARMRDLLAEQRSLAVAPSPDDDADTPRGREEVAADAKTAKEGRSERTWGAFQKTGRRFHAAKEVVGGGILGVFNHVGEAVHTLKSDIKTLANMPPQQVQHAQQPIPPQNAGSLQGDLTAQVPPLIPSAGMPDAQTPADDERVPSPEMPERVPSMPLRRVGSEGGSAGGGGAMREDSGPPPYNVYENKSRDNARCDPHGSVAAMEDLLRSMGQMGLETPARGGGDGGRDVGVEQVHSSGAGAPGRVMAEDIFRPPGHSVMEYRGGGVDRPPSMMTLRGGNAQSPPEQSGPPHLTGSVPPLPFNLPDASPTPPPRMTAPPAGAGGQGGDQGQHAGVGAANRKKLADVVSLTSWPGPETFPVASGQIEPMDVSKLQRHLFRAHEAALTTRKTEQLAEGQAMARSDDGTLVCIAQGQPTSSDKIGVILLPSGARFAGQINKDGQMHGVGGLRWPAGKGGAVVVAGQGASETAAMVTAYLGEFREGLFDGQGRMWMSGGVEFCGEFRNGVRQGWGCEVRQGGFSPLVGSFLDGRYVSGMHMASIC